MDKLYNLVKNYNYPINVWNSLEGTKEFLGTALVN